MAQAEIKEFNIDELCTLTDLPKRTIRYYIQIGLVEKPVGETRAARYGQRHLEQLLRIRRWTQDGLSLERVRELLSSPPDQSPERDRRGTLEVWSHFIVDEGVEVRLNPEQTRLSTQQTQQFFAAVIAAYQQIKQENPTA